MLAAGGTVTAAAEAAGVARQRIYEWLRSDAFAAALREEERQTLQRLAAGLAAGAERALQTLLLLQEDQQPPAVRVRAAEALLRHALALRQHLTAEERLEALEMRITEVVIGDKIPPEFDTEEVT